MIQITDAEMAVFRLLESEGSAAAFMYLLVVRKGGIEDMDAAREAMELVDDDGKGTLAFDCLMAAEG